MFSPFRLVLISLLFVTIAGLADAETQPPHYVLTDTLKLPGSTRWDFLAMDSPNHHLFITRGDSVDVLDTNSIKVIGTIPGLEGVHGVALALDLGKGFITEGKANRVTVIDLKTFKVSGTVPTGKKPDAVIYDKASRRVFVADGESDELTAIDATTNAVLGSIALGGAPEFAAVDEKGKLYINLEDKSQIAVVDTNALKVMAHYDLAPACEGPAGLAIDKQRKRLFSACANKNMLVIGAGTGKILDTIPIGEHSDAAAYDAGTGLAFSSNGADGTLTVAGLCDDGHYKVLETVPTKISARTMAVDPVTHTIYLSAAETDGFDPPTAQHPEPRRHVKPDTFMILILALSP